MRAPSIARILLFASPALLAHAAIYRALGQEPLPPITVTPPKETPKAAKQPPKQKAKAAPVAAAPPPAPAPPPAAAPPAESALVSDTKAFNAARENILPKLGVTTYDISHQDIEALPQGSNQSIDKVLLQAPGVTQDSAASGNLHLRNDHANLQYRINGIIIPDGVSGFGQLLETGFVGSATLITGALPAQYGLHNTGIVDITTRSGAQSPGGTISFYGGGRDAFTPSIEYGGSSGRTEYFFTGRGFFSDLGLENPTSSVNAIHDQTRQGRAFGYTSTLLDDSTRLTTISGLSIQKYQIPDNPGQPLFPLLPSGIGNFDSAKLNENQLEENFYNVIALQKKLEDTDLQIAYFSRYSSLHFTPDQIGDLLLNGVASDVYRSSFVNGVQGDGAYRLNPQHTLRAGFYASVESTDVSTKDTLFPVDSSGIATNPPYDVVDATSKLGYLLGVYVQDEWKITNRLTLNTGLRFDQMFQFVDANQLSPRVSLTYKPVDDTTLHIGYARYFTPPPQTVAGPVNLALVAGTTAAPALCPTLPQPASCQAPVLPERSHYFDAGATQKVMPGLEVGVDAYYKIARDLLDDGLFGQAYVLDGFNYDKAFNKGVELSAKYQSANFKAYGNLAWGQQMATNRVSDQFLFDPVELAYTATHYIYTDHAQTWTGSAGASYLWNGTRFSTDMIYGSGLRSDFANTGHVPLYTQVNAGVSHEFTWSDGTTKPTTVRFDVINVFDSIYEIRSGSGVGVFAPQFGPRRAFLLGLAQKF
jgi:outer membrane receptor protein involved in Fe transport